jgi:hypothetical protein
MKTIPLLLTVLLVALVGCKNLPFNVSTDGQSVTVCPKPTAPLAVEPATAAPKAETK